MTAPYAIGVDVCGTKILAGIVARDGAITRRRERATPHDTQEHVLAELEAAVAELMNGDVAAVGFGVPSPIDQRRGVVVQSVNLPLEDIALRDLMRERLGLPVGLDNDANAAAIGEWRAGAGRGVDNLVMLTLGTGLGGGVIADGRPFRGATGAGAELGHVVIVHDGRPCQGACRGRGHLEPYVTGLAATAAAREAFGPSADAHRLIRLANEGDAQAREILGPGKLLCPEVMVLLETDPAKARAAARTALASYIQLENYANNWRRLGFGNDDLAGGGSNRFVDANIAWGDEGAIRKRLQLFWDAGADHVCIQSIHPSGSRTTIDERVFDLLAPASA